MPVTEHTLPLIVGHLSVVYTTKPFTAAAAQHGLRNPGAKYDGARALTYAAAPKHEHPCHWIVMLRPDSTPGVIAHEALHVVMAARRYNGWGPVTYKHDEDAAALLEWIVDAITASRRR